jgi:hypothetical protein
LAAHLDVRLVAPPRPAHRSFVPLPALLKGFRILDSPAENRCVCNQQPTLSHHLDQIPVAQFIAELPAQAQNDDFVLDHRPPNSGFRGFVRCAIVPFLRDRFKSYLHQNPKIHVFLWTSMVAALNIAISWVDLLYGRPAEDARHSIVMLAGYVAPPRGRPRAAAGRR